MIRATAAAVASADVVKYFDFDSTAGEFVSTPDPGYGDDLDVRVRLGTVAGAGTNRTVASQYVSSGSQRSWEFRIGSSNDLSLVWSQAGTFGAVVGSSANPDLATNPYIRFTRAASSGDVIFYTSPDGVTWTQLGTTRSTTSGALHNSTAAVKVGEAGNSDLRMNGHIYWAEVRWDASVVARMDASDAVNATTAWTGAVDGLTWTPNGAGLTLVTV